MWDRLQRRPLLTYFVYRALALTWAFAPFQVYYLQRRGLSVAQVFDLVAGIALQKGRSFDVKVGNLLRTVLDNGRLSALPEIAAQYGALVNASSGVSDATIHSAFAIESAQLGDVVAALERRFERKLNAQVVIDPELIGGIRVVVGDEVLDTSVRARLEQMRVALTA